MTDFTEPVRDLPNDDQVVDASLMTEDQENILRLRVLDQIEKAKLPPAVVTDEERNVFRECKENAIRWGAIGAVSGVSTIGAIATRIFKNPASRTPATYIGFALAGLGSALVGGYFGAASTIEDCQYRVLQLPHDSAYKQNLSRMMRRYNPQLRDRYHEQVLTKAKEEQKELLSSLGR